MRRCSPPGYSEKPVVCNAGGESHSQACFCAHRRLRRVSLPVAVPQSWQHGPGPEVNSCFLPETASLCVGEERAGVLCSPLACEAQLGCLPRKYQPLVVSLVVRSDWGSDVGCRGPVCSWPGDSGYGPTCMEHPGHCGGCPQRIIGHIDGSGDMELRAEQPSVLAHKTLYPFVDLELPANGAVSMLRPTPPAQEQSCVVGR